MFVMFAGLGTALITGSRAATPGDSASIISLAPASASVREGNIINIAVNVNTNGETAKSIDAFVEYPSASLELQSVQYACQAPFRSGTDDTYKSSTSGTVAVSCANPDGVEGNYTMATLVFKALTDTSDAPITVTDASTVVRQADNKKVLGKRQNARMKFQPRSLSATKTPRAVPNYTSKSVCATPEPGKRRCNVLQTLTSDGQPIASADAAFAGYGPTELHTAYQLPCTPGGPVAAVCATPATYGPATIAITDAGGYETGASGLESDLAAYNQKFGIPPCTVASGCLTLMNQTGGSTMPAPVSGWSGEIILDIEAAHAICQTCKIVFIGANDAGDALDVAHNFATTLKPIVVSDSWSGGTDISTAGNSKYKHNGVAQLVADGDNGIETALNTPVDFPEVTAVSGTTLKLNTDGTRASETLWTGSGAGCSPSLKAPAWQTSLSNWNTAGCGTQRAYGDITAVADPKTGAAIYYSGAWTIYGGTSLAAPVLAGMFALANGSPQTGIPSTTLVTQMLYTNYTYNPALFYDITSGTDCTNGVTTHCTAGTGYDVPSGLGVPTLAALRPGGTSTTPPAVPPPTPPTPTPTPPTPPPTPPPSTGSKVGDLNSDNKVNISDMSILLSAWGKSNATADLNKSGKVDISDLSILLSHWNT